jgi:hypothetical protein
MVFLVVDMEGMQEDGLSFGIALDSDSVREVRFPLL